MAKDNYFNSLDDVYKRVLPAINTKLDELKRIHFNVRNIDIWDYCVKYMWRNRSDLRIYEMVSDILNVDELKLRDFIKDRNGDYNERQQDNI